MFRTIEDFSNEWKFEVEATSRMLSQITDSSLDQAVWKEGRTLGRIAWHIALTTGEMLRHAGLKLDGNDHDPLPATTAEIRERFTSDAAMLASELPKHWTDSMLNESVPMYGQQWKRGDVLTALIKHLVHHRGQMTVLMRQAGLTVPGVYGPAREEWSAIGMPVAE